MKQAASLKNIELPMLLPGVKLNTSTTDFAPIESFQLVTFDGTRWGKAWGCIGQLSDAPPDGSGGSLSKGFKTFQDA